MEIKIPTIYEENIDYFIYKNSEVIFKYYSDIDEEICVVFKSVYGFTYIEFDYMDYAEMLIIERGTWKFGLELIENSPLINKLVKDNFPDGDVTRLARAFGGEMEKLKHYHLAIDDFGFYNILCKELEIQYVDQQRGIST